MEVVHINNSNINTNKDNRVNDSNSELSDLVCTDNVLSSAGPCNL